MIYIMSILPGAAHCRTSAAAVKQADLDANIVRFQSEKFFILILFKILQIEHWEGYNERHILVPA
jgi:hypothetical protein